MTAADHTPSGSTPCRRSLARARWESITWPGKPTAYPCAHDHAHCDFIGCVEHIDGMHIDYRGDAIVHVGCDMCRPPADHTPSPAADGPSVFIGSGALLVSLHDTYIEHIGMVEPDGPDGPYMWCACGWRSDDLDGNGTVSDNPGLSYAVHLSNAQHAAAVKALQSIVRRVVPSPATDGLREAIERASRVFGWQHLARYSGQSPEWLDRTLGAIVREALAAHPAPPSETATEGVEHVEWGVRYGDGEVDYWTTTRDGQTHPGDRSLAEETIVSARADIAAGHADADDYEPMSLVRRTVTTYAPIVGEWEPVEETQP